MKSAVAQKVVFENFWVKCFFDEIELPMKDGRLLKNVPRFLVEKSDAVTILAYRLDELDAPIYAIVKQKRWGADQEELWEVPAGVIDAGEEPGPAARRETREELGFEAVSVKALPIVWTVAPWSTERLHFFEVELGAEVGQDFDEDEEIEVGWRSLSQLQRMVLSGEIADLKTVAAVGYLVSIRDAK